MSKTSIEVIKKKIIDWLNAEKFRHEEVSDQNAYFNIVVYVSNLGFNTIQRRDREDSIFIGTNLNFTPQQITLLKEMNTPKKQSYFWTLRMRLLNSPTLASFEIRPNPPEEVRTVFISSKPIFYDGLSKGKLFSILFDVHKAVIMTIWLLEQISGATTSSQMPSMHA